MIELGPQVRAYALAAPVDMRKGFEGLYALATQALGRDAGRIAEGALADLVAIDQTHPSLCALKGD